MTQPTYRIEPGNWDQLGAVFVPGGVNFSILSRYAERAELLLFDREEATTPFQVVTLDPRINHTFFFWHCLVRDLPSGTWYNWRVDGGRDTRESGSRIDPGKALLDPRAISVSDRLWDRPRASQPGDNCATAMRGQVLRDDYDWEGDRPLEIPLNESVIYEMHLGDFTRHPASGVAHPGTYRALIDKVPYLVELGITHVELLPVMAFDRQDVPPATAARGLCNHWGYSTHSFFAPHPHYAQEPARARDEFRDMVKALHRAGIGVILDVVFNHTAEGGVDGPTINFKGLTNEIAYHLDFSDRRLYRDYTGCGNTLNCNHPLVTRLLVAVLLYWVEEMHVDGFRFDLASALARGEDGNPLYHAPILWAIELSPVLRRSHLIAEAWDAAGLYQVGDFPGFRWAEWNGRYRDLMRSFVRGDPGLIPEVATRLAGSSDLYQPRERLPTNSVNFITCHDGFTLWDLVSYEHKHNQANGEGNRDGSDQNISWNCGVEGPTDDPAILALRQRQARNCIGILMLSQGIPMLLSGDEILHTKGGNNNTYCQDNAVSWFDWDQVAAQRPMFDFVRGMIALRRRHPSLTRTRYLTGRPEPGQALPDITWHGVDLNEPGWDNPQNRAIAFTLAGVSADEPPLHVMLNMGMEPLEFAVPPLPDRCWTRAIDTVDEPGVFPPDSVAPLHNGRIRVGTRSLVVLEAFRPEWS